MGFTLKRLEPPTLSFCFKAHPRSLHDHDSLEAASRPDDAATRMEAIAILLAGGWQLQWR